MKFRTILFSSTVLLALTASFGFSSARRLGPYANWIVNASGEDYCITTQIRTDQMACSRFNTGPVCTVTPGVLGPLTAYDPIFFNNCLYPFRQP